MTYTLKSICLQAILEPLDRGQIKLTGIDENTRTYILTEFHIYKLEKMYASLDIINYIMDYKLQDRLPRYFWEKTIKVFSWVFETGDDRLEQLLDTPPFVVFKKMHNQIKQFNGIWKTITDKYIVSNIY